jgi:hypothetical protein
MFSPQLGQDSFYLKSLESGKTFRSLEGTIGSGDRSGKAKVATEPPDFRAG